MGPEQARERVTPVREFIASRRQFDAELGAIRPSVDQLASDFEFVRAELIGLTLELPLTSNWETPPIALQKHEASIDEQGLELPAGLFGVVIQPVDARSSTSYSSTDNIQETTEFELHFVFQPTDRMNEPAWTPLPAAGEPETTYEYKEKVPKRFESHFKPSLSAPPRTYQGPEDMEALRNYITTYLPSRRGAVEALLSTIVWIKSALRDTELNPWYQELLEERRQEAERRAARQRELEANWDEAGRIATGAAKGNIKRLGVMRRGR